MLLWLALILVTVSCKKYLDAKPDAALSTPSSLNDLQGLLDYYNGMNTQYPGGTEILADNYYLTDANWSSVRRIDQRSYYIWQPENNNNIEWNQPYHNIYTCNLVLETLKEMSISKDDQVTANAIKGSALFFRGAYYYALAQLFIKPFDEQTAAADKGLPLRLTTDFNIKSKRSSVEDTYLRILADFKEAATLLPVTTAIKSRPGKAAAYGFLARTYLAMSDYTNAYAYADSCLSLYNTLIDYNTLDSNTSIPFQRFNDEVIFQATSYAVQPIAPKICMIDTILYRSYDIDDLRRPVCFKKNNNGTYAFKGDYDGTSNNGNGHSFTGIVTDEQYLIMAECAARLGKTQNALDLLNALMSKRWRAGNFVPYTSTNNDTLLTMILNERRKELLFRGTRWTDLRRLNKDPRFAVTLNRTINGTLYELKPGDARYTELFPKTVIDYSGMQQNP